MCKFDMHDQTGFAWVISASWQTKEKDDRPKMINKTDVLEKMVSYTERFLLHQTLNHVLWKTGFL